MLKRFVPAVFSMLLLALPLRAAATDFTDIWYTPVESGWGVNMVEAQGTTESVIFATFFIYDTNNVPTWYATTMTADANGNFSGTLYSATGTYFGAPWQGDVVTAAGSASFSPLSAYTGTLVYSLNSGPTVTKVIQRQTLITILLAGNYAGGYNGTYSGSNCTISNTYTDNFTATVTQPGDGTATFQIDYPNDTSGNTTFSCSLSGTLTQYGQLFTMPDATYTCNDGTNTTAAVDEIQATAHGLELIYDAQGSAGGTCEESAVISGVLL